MPRKAIKFDKIPTVENRPEVNQTEDGSKKNDEMMADQPNMSLSRFERDEAKGKRLIKKPHKSTFLEHEEKYS